jgi:alkylation response protein AidB-like acyl-CoA dehydrogenase
MAAYLPEAAAKEVYGGDWAVNAAGSIAGSGRAVVVEGGYRLSGRWAFATNSHGCPWLLGFFTVVDGDVPRCHPDGHPDRRFFFFPASTARILDTWDTGGLRGTASNDILVEDVVVGEAYGFARDAQPQAPGNLFRDGLTLWPATAFAAVPLGIARAAIDALAELAQEKVSTLSRSPLREQPVVRYELARADARLRAARAFFYEMIHGIWSAIEAGQEVGREPRALLHLACTHVADTSRDVVQTMYQLGGGSSVYRGSPLDRCMRDTHVATQHAAIGVRNYEEAARVRLGMSPT